MAHATEGGAIGGFIILMLWIYIASLILLVGELLLRGAKLVVGRALGGDERGLGLDLALVDGVRAPADARSRARASPASSRCAAAPPYAGAAAARWAPTRA